MYEVIKQRWQQLSGLGRAGLVSGLAVILASVIFGMTWILRDDYQILFSDLNPQDASAMVAELDRIKIPYRLADGGTAILVERESVYKTRLKLMGKGLDLHGAVGLEIFSNADFGMTEFAQKVNFQRALQGELARTIMGFEEVKFARVHLVLPESGLLKRQAAKPKASISLVMRGGAKLASEQISGIQRLVAASVPEIDPSAVTIVDQHGVAVSKAISDDANAGVSGRLDTKRQIEEYLTRKVVSVLDRAVGPGRAIVSVDVSLNYDQVKVTKEDVLPLANTSGQSVGAIARRRESNQGGDPFSDLLKSVGSSGNNRSSQGAIPSSTSSEIEFVNGRRIEQVVSQPGGVTRLSVGVMLPDVIDPVELAKLKEVVAMAVGVNVARGDAIVVYNHSSGSSEGADVKNDEPGLALVKADAEAFGVQKSDFGNVSPVVLSSTLLAMCVLIGLTMYRQMRRQHLNSYQAKLTSEERALLLAEISRWASESKA